MSGAELAMIPILCRKASGMLARVVAAIRPMLARLGPMPLGYFATFLIVALDEGHGVSHYARALGVHRAIMSRYLRVLGDRGRDNKPGYGLLDVADHSARAGRRQVFLTPKGRALADEVLRALDGA